MTEPTTTARTPEAVSDAVECAIGLNVDCGGPAGVHRVRDAVLAAIQPELDALAALRAVARGYCPSCGRGDAAPTVEDWEQQRDKAGRLEIANRALNTAALEAVERAERAEAAIARVREYVATSDDDGIRTRETVLGIVGDWPGPETEAASAAATKATEREKHSGPNTAFCVLCLSGEHERVDQEQPDA